MNFEENKQINEVNIEYILLIMNCEKYNYKRIRQKETWLNYSNIFPINLYFHVIGNINLENDYLIDYENNILYIKVEDDYVNLPKKVIRAYEIIINNFPNIKYIFKTDDDQNLIDNKYFNILINILNKKEPKVHYGGFIIDVKNPYFSKYYRIHSELPKYLPVYKTKYANGRFYFLTKEALYDLINNKELIEKEYLEDYAIGFNLNEKFKTNMLFIDSNKYFVDFVNF